ncbi:MAG TPA: hypothetical protein VJN96_16035 [Vicinamibacterales bacterium]|nr:hypothetical protein [Vicinamibacterales bacterium]
MTRSARPASIAAACVVLAVSAVLAEQAPAPGPPAIADLLDRAAAYVQKYEAEFSAVVSEEHYTQSSSVRGLSRRRDLKSDVLVVNAGVGGWMGFRDVYEVDSRPVRDHDQRLTKLFVEATADTMTHARQIADESARYNLGAIKRNINVPTMALAFLRRDNQSRSRFTIEGTAKVENVNTVILGFTELDHPTLIRSGDADAPASGRFWIDPANGRIVRSQLRAQPSKVNATVTVTYGATPKIEIWVPISMSENYRGTTGESISGSASYKNFRRFSVDVSTIVKAP